MTLRAMLLTRCIVSALFIETFAVAQSRPTTAGAPTSVEQLEREAAADPNYLIRQDSDGATVLHRACERGDVLVVRRAIELGADPNCRGKNNYTPLLATMGGAVSDMIRRTSRPHGSTQPWTAVEMRALERQTRDLPDAARGPMQFVELTKLLIAKGANVNARMDKPVYTPLGLAINALRDDLVRLLIDAHADVNAPSESNNGIALPLLVLAAPGNVETVRLLLDAGADPTAIPESSRQYFLHRAMMNIDVFKLLLDRGLSLLPGTFEQAARAHQAEAMAEILQRRALRSTTAPAVSAVDQKTLDRALFEAVQSANDEKDFVKCAQIVRVLLDAGASPNAPENTGEAFVVAIVHRNESTAAILRERKPKVDWSHIHNKEIDSDFIAYGTLMGERPDGLSELESLGMPLGPLAAAVLGRDVRLHKLVTDHPEIVKTSSGATLLYAAAGAEQSTCVKLLLDAGADPNERIPSWDTPNVGPRPLQAAALKGYIAIAKLLIEHGAKPSLLELHEDDEQRLTSEMRALLKTTAK